MQTIAGSCHCGSIKFEVDTDLAEFTKCDCSLCVKKNAVMLQVHEDQFRLISGDDVLGLYQWNFKIAKHHYCKNCGIYTFHRKRAAPDCYGINAYCLDADISAVSIRQAHGKTMSVSNQA